MMSNPKAIIDSGAPTLQELKLEFVGLDKDGNGEVSVDELETLLRSMQVKLRLSETETEKP